MRKHYPFLFWTPRILTIGFALFISFFAADAIQPERNWLLNLKDLMVHLHPVFILAVVLAVSWRYEWIGASIFLLMAVLYIYWAWGRFPVSVYFAIAGPLSIIAIFFGLGWYYKQKKCSPNHEH